MQLQRRTVVGMLAGAIGAPAIARFSAPSMSLQELIRRHTRAMGGAIALDRVHSKWASLTIEENGAPINGIYQCVATPAWRIDVYASGQHVFCEGLDTKGPWIWPSSDPAPKDATPDARRTGIQGIEFHLFGLHRFPERGHKLFLERSEIIDGTPYHVVHVVMRDAYETYLFIDTKSYLIARRRDERAPHPDLDPTRKFLEKRYSDYRMVDNIMTAFVEDQYNLTDNKIVNKSVLKEVRYNHHFAAGTFDRKFVPA